MNAIVISSTIEASADYLYKIFIDSKLHSKITGSKATIIKKVGSKMTAWDGYISGKILLLEENKKIVQTWRTTEFNQDDKDSILEILFEAIDKNKTKLTLKHKDLPPGTEEDYKKGWKEFYIKRLKEHLKIK